MILETDIPLRSDGTLLAEAGNPPTLYYFTANDNGELVCDVRDDAHVAELIERGCFFPHSPSDYAAAAALMDGDSDDDDLDDESVDLNAAPIEAPAKPRRKRV